MIEINGRVYPMWSQFVERKDEWIGGILQELEDSWPKVADGPFPKTFIHDITLTENGPNAAYFSVKGETYSCGGSTECLGVIGGEEGWITFSGYGGHKWRIQRKQDIKG